MKLDTYKEKIRTLRDVLKSCDEDLYTIYHQGCKELVEWSLDTKTIGVGKIATIASMDYKEQHKFLVWVLEKKRTAKEIDIKLLSLI